MAARISRFQRARPSPRRRHAEVARMGREPGAATMPLAALRGGATIQESGSWKPRIRLTKSATPSR
eukprot:1602150-Pyramimonas_sp.AAC.1